MTVATPGLMTLANDMAPERSTRGVSSRSPGGCHSAATSLTPNPPKEGVGLAS